MAIQLSSGNTRPAIEYNRVFVTALDLAQAHETSDTTPPKFALNLYYRMYGVHDGVRFFEEGEPKVLRVADYVADAVKLAEKGDMSLIQALGAIEGALAAIIAYRTSIPASVVPPAG